MLEYNLVISTNTFAVISTVNKSAEDGWIPIGGISTYKEPCGATVFCQAMVKEGAPESHERKSQEPDPITHDFRGVIFDVAMDGPWPTSTRGGRCNYCGNECLGPDEEHYARGHDDNCVYVTSRKLLEAQGIDHGMYSLIRHKTLKT